MPKIDQNVEIPQNALARIGLGFDTIIMLSFWVYERHATPL